MKGWRLAILILCLALVLLIVLYPDSKRDEKGEVEAVKVGVEEGVVSFNGQTLHAGEETVARVEPAEADTMAVNTTEVPTPTAIPARVLAVRLVDALGDPIPNGMIEFASQTYKSASSEFLIRDVTEGAYSLAAKAEGYESASETVEVPAEEPVTITLEYLCSFDIEIVDRANNDAPLEGAEVIVWQGPQIVRPIPETVSFNTYDITNNDDRHGTIVVRRTSDDLRVQRSLKYGLGQEVNFEGWKNPTAGDVLVALSGTCWRLDDHNVFPDHYSSIMGTFQRRVRMWDSIALYGKYGGTSYFRGSLEFERNGERFPNSTYAIITDPKENIAARGVTDHTGRCRFENLPPRLYFVQGRTPIRRTCIDALTPVEKGRRLSMYTSGDQMIIVTVEKKNELFRLKKKIENAQVILTGLGQQFHGIAKT
ncbi:MAG: carboxypeptidase-like regulatory domain-containing protein, partial [bacterium]